MFSGHFNVKPDADGEFFLDRNPKHFEMILNFFRTGKMMLLDSLSESTIQELIIELNFYQLNDLVLRIQSRNDSIVLVGGNDQKNDDLNKVHIYDPNTNKW